eukprot:TRINITY_DN32488_c0_g1_i1.p1 TRINITY_DN32488_c0_g1~~TRINITY_DN32488_c0_g1_i1.p1  ORF type:complete len:1064 (+),score=195.58 TRINITY_DN32488_c0_g1_i1:201-3392(+)
MARSREESPSGTTSNLESPDSRASSSGSCVEKHATQPAFRPGWFRRNGSFDLSPSAAPMGDMQMKVFLPTEDDVQATGEEKHETDLVHDFGVVRRDINRRASAKDMSNANCTPTASDASRRGLLSAQAKLLVYCAGPSLERARPLLKRLEECGMKVEVRTDQHLAEECQDMDCHAILVLWSQYFVGPLEARLWEITEQAARAGALVLNNARMLSQMQDRRWLLNKLREHGLPTPTYVESSRDGPASSTPDLEEHDDYIIVSGSRINKPFVEKPVDRRDREIYVYFPKSSGGGRALLSTRESGDVEYVCRFDPIGRVRREGSFVYQEYLQSEGFVVQVVCVGGLSYGNAVMSGMSRAQSSMELPSQPCAVWLRQEEKLIASKLNVLLSQTLFGITFLRSQTANGSSTSFIIDVWPGVPRSGLGAHRDDVVRALLKTMSSRLPMPHKMARSRSLPRITAEEASSKKASPLPDGLCSAGVTAASTAKSFEESFRSHTECWDADDAEADLLCVILVARHAERTPKQKVKAKVKLASDFAAGWLCGWLSGQAARMPAGSVGEAPQAMELRSKDQMQRLSEAARSLQSDGHDIGSLADALSCIKREGATCHAKVGYDDKCLVIGLKWGGELTAAGISDAEDFGKSFRSESYPKEDIDELHATLRHDIKIYASRESRCQQTAAAVCKGLLRLDSPLPPIIAAFVRTDEFGRLEGGSKNYVGKAVRESSPGNETCKKKAEKLPPADTPWAELEAMIGVPCVASSLRQHPSPRPAFQELVKLVQRLAEVLNAADLVKALAGGETPLLLRERYKDVLSDLGKSEPQLGKVSHLLDILEYDHRHNQEAFPEEAVHTLEKALPIAEALCDVVMPLEAAIDRRAAGPATSDGPGVGLLNKLRWDLRVASGADLGDKERAHLLKHEALYKAVASVTAPDAPTEALPPACVRSRLYFSHNSQLEGLLGLMLDSVATKAEESRCGSECHSESEPSNTLTKAQELQAVRFGFLAHFLVRLWRRRCDSSLRVTCDVCKDGAENQRVRLFDLPLAEVDAGWSAVLEPADRVATDCEKNPEQG